MTEHADIAPKTAPHVAAEADSGTSRDTGTTPITGRFAARFDGFPPYPLADVPQIRRDLRARGIDVIDLGAGDADLSPPPAAIAALREAANVPENSRYAFQLGLPAFREQISAWMQQRFGVALDPYREILPLIGSKEGIAHVALVYAEPGDVTVMPDPGYLPYIGGTLFAGAEPYPIPLRAENRFLIPFAEIPETIARRTRIVYLNYPNNPTTATAPLSYLEDAVRFCRERGAVLMYDNAYSEIAFDCTPPSIFEVDGAMDVAIEFHSLSKTYNMTGWRIGWAAGSAQAIAALSRVKTFIDTGQFLPVQAGAAAALASWSEWVPGNVAEFRKRRDVLARALADAGFDAHPPAATMYLWVPVPGGDSHAFARRALTGHGVVLMPGAALGKGGQGYFRAALTQPPERLAEAARRLATLL